MQQEPREYGIASHADGTVFCGGPFNHEDHRVAEWDPTRDPEGRTLVQAIHDRKKRKGTDA